MRFYKSCKIGVGVGECRLNRVEGGLYTSMCSCILTSLIHVMATYETDLLKSSSFYPFTANTLKPHKITNEMPGGITV
jgi:hypothetical protein